MATSKGRKNGRHWALNKLDHDESGRLEIVIFHARICLEQKKKPFKLSLRLYLVQMLNRMIYA
jgi:hypothetical protein